MRVKNLIKPLTMAAVSLGMVACIQQPEVGNDRGGTGRAQQQQPPNNNNGGNNNNNGNRGNGGQVGNSNPRPPVVIDDIAKGGRGNLNAAFDITPKPNNNRIDNDFIPFFDQSSRIQIDLNNQVREGENIQDIRYVTLTHLDFLDLSEQEFIRLKSGIINSLSLLMNSVSKEDNIKRLEPIDKRMDVFRIDIDDFGWNQAEWDRLTRDVNNNDDKERYPYPNNFDPSIQNLIQQIQDQVPVVRGDWLLAEATKVRSYTDLVNLPNNLNQLENQIGVDRTDNIVETFEDPDDNPRAIRVGIGPGNSRMSDNNRIIERHDSNDGFFWVGYDFAPAQGNIRRLVFNSPFGPVRDNGINDIQVNNGQVNRRAFDPQTISLMFSKDNGLPGFMLTNANGNRIDEANTQVLINPNDRNSQGVVESGFSCMQCHLNNAAGSVAAGRDEMRRVFADANPETTDDDFTDGILALHQPQNVVDAQMRSDNERVARAIQQTQLIQNVDSPLMVLINYYELDMSIDMVASELNLTVEQLNRVRPTLDENLQVLLEAADTKSLERDTFELIYDNLIEDIFDENFVAVPVNNNN